jgi:hypothetical protein
MFTRTILGFLVTALVTLQPTTSQSISPPHIPTVGYCQLLANMDDYDGKQIRITAEYNSGFEHSVFSDHSCVESFDPKRLIWVDFDESLSSNTRPNTLAKFQAAQYRPETNKRGVITDQRKNWYVELTIVGILYKSKDPGFGFGHTNAYPQKLVVSKIERVGKLKKL